VAKGPGTAYFDAHAEMDIEHSRIERELLERHLDSEDHEAIATNVRRVLDRLWELLLGVCQRQEGVFHKRANIPRPEEEELWDIIAKSRQEVMWINR
jgi:pyrroloquinoline quinone (PQQ) biosynthesis protein C